MSKTNLTRRSFVKVSALAGAAAAVGASMAGCMQEAAPEEELAGTGEAGVSSTEGLTKMPHELPMAAFRCARPSPT